MPNGTYGGVRGTETKVGQKTFVSRPTRLSEELSSHSWSICFVVTVDDISDGLHHDLDV